MDFALRIAAYVVFGVILAALNGLYIRRIYYEFHPTDPSPVIVPFRIVGLKDEPEKGKALAQMLIARVDQINDQLATALDIVNRKPDDEPEDSETPATSTADAASEPTPEDISFQSRNALNQVEFGEFEQVDINLSFGGVDLGGLVSWAQKLAMSDRMVSISMQYDGPNATVAMTPNRANGDSIWLEMNGSDDRAVIGELAYAFVKRGWEAGDGADIGKLTLAEFKTLTKLISGVASVKLAGQRTQRADIDALESDVNTLLTAQSRAWE